MASAFGHAVVAIALGKSFSQKHISWLVILVGVICTIVPDLDVIAFKFGIPYESFWGHRGFSHSILFALLFGILCAICFSLRRFSWKVFCFLWSFFFLCTVSHALLDAMTNGGLGVALFSPWDDTRYFLPWRPIAVSPIGVERFFSEWGLKVLRSEVLWIGLPSAVLAVGSIAIRKLSK
ncbi:MAG: metal-dependent hydrolase [Reichenbachiella sp.]|uniref:metal-dependent hydrolase n=1 Tax=Reichenbachiella sp. TaxID=2184521 RepID=UPI00326764E4